jgi:hypothetical protein
MSQAPALLLVLLRRPAAAVDTAARRRASFGAARCIGAARRGDCGARVASCRINAPFRAR